MNIGYAEMRIAAPLVRTWPIIALRGLCGVLFGLLAVAMPWLALTSLVILFAAYLVIDGGCGLIAARVAARHDRRWGALAAEGVVGILAGALLFAVPTLAVLVLVTMAAAWALLSGVALLFASVRFGHGAGFMTFAAIVSIALGCALLMDPADAALALSICLAAYALVFGAALLAVAWRLRRVTRVGFDQ